MPYSPTLETMLYASKKEMKLQNSVVFATQDTITSAGICQRVYASTVLFAEPFKLKCGLGHCGQMASNNPVSTRRFCNRFYFFSSAPSLLLTLCVSLQDRRIVLKGDCCGITLLFSFPSLFHFDFSRCCCWLVMTHGEMPTVSTRMSETSLEMMISLRIILLKYQKWACHSSWEREGVWLLEGETVGSVPSHQIQSCWEVCSPSWVWVFSRSL